MAARINSRGNKRPGSEIEGEPIAGPSSLHTLTPERPSKKSRQAERRLCPLCNKLIPLDMLAQHTEMELARVNEVILDEAVSAEAGPSDPIARYAAFFCVIHRLNSDWLSVTVTAGLLHFVHEPLSLP
ncbi:hypothetical protein FRC08_010559 [Ceratobasidium sp. 394]|nr:hypothetical protein FRC08_010559 [Ceratobasidium sp. 394]